jgi:VanZ family protein
MVLIFYLSSQSDPLPAVTSRFWDKWIHVVEYGALAVLMCPALTAEGRGLTRVAVLAVIAASVYGMTDEWHQSYVPFRSADVSDWVADTIGAALAAGGYALVGFYVRRVHLDAHRLSDEIH